MKNFMWQTLKLLRSDLYRRDECTAYEVLRPQKLESDRHELKYAEKERKSIVTLN